MKFLQQSQWGFCRREGKWTSFANEGKTMMSIAYSPQQKPELVIY